MKVAALLAMVIGVFVVIADWSTIRPSCAVGISGTSASISVDGIGAGGVCHQILVGNGGTYEQTQSPSQPVICEETVDGRRFIVRDDGLLKLVGNAICQQLHGHSANPAVVTVPAPLPTAPVPGPTPVPTIARSSRDPQPIATVVTVPTLAPPVFTLLGEPAWWIVPYAPGWGPASRGKLYFAQAVENISDRVIEIGVLFHAYTAQGVPIGTSSLPSTASIAPHEKARVILEAPNEAAANIAGVQVTSQVSLRRVWSAPSPEYEIVESGLPSGSVNPNPMETLYNPYALVRTNGNNPADMTLVFRLYDADKIQVAYCVSDNVRVEPGVSRRIACLGPVVDAKTGPVTMRVDANPQ